MYKRQILSFANFADDVEDDIEEVSILLLTFSPAISSEVSSAFFEDDIAGDIRTI